MKHLLMLLLLISAYNLKAQYVWYGQDSGTNHIFFDVQFLNEEIGWICGNTGLVLHTSDGGDTWIEQNTPPNNTFYSLYFIDDGGSYDGTGSSPEPLDPSVDWPYSGYGLMGGPRYYYTLFSFGIDGEVVIDAELSMQSAYAYASWGHYNWLRKQFPSAYLKLDKTNDLKGILESVGTHFDSMKTSFLQSFKEFRKACA